MAKYNVLKDHEDQNFVCQSPYWVVAVVRLGLPLSFSRLKQESVTKDVTMGGFLRADTPLIVTGDCVQLQISNSKRSCTKTMSATLKQTDINYLVEILPGDWVFAWIVDGEEKYLDLIDRISRGKACNRFDDGLKFVGRAHSIRKSLHVSADGLKSVSYSLQSVGFRELESIFYFDQALASQDTLKKEFGQWMARISLRVNEIFRANAQGVPENNINLINLAFLDCVVGKGPAKGRQPTAVSANGAKLTASPQLENEAPYSYLVPVTVSNLLGREPADRSKANNVTSYADILELLQGIQKYENLDNTPKTFIPTLSESESSLTRRVTPHKMLGTFLPLPPVLANRTLWSVFQQYLNPAINELYTCLRVNPEGLIVPTIVFRQIPFTTSVYYTKKDHVVTYFLELPRWQIPATLITDVDIGRSDATRTNLVHVYGTSSYLANGGTPVQYQMIKNPPIRDDLDIQRSGVRPYVTTVDSWVSQSMGAVPGTWMSLIADWMMGSQYTLNGTVSTKGIFAPICEGDNLEFDGCVYHIESVSHSVVIGMDGMKSFTTSLTLTNGMRAVEGPASDHGSVQPIYAGFRSEDNRGFDPGLALQGNGFQNELSNDQGVTERQKELRQQDLDLQEQNAADLRAKAFSMDPLGLGLDKD